MSGHTYKRAVKELLVSGHAFQACRKVVQC